jgi:wobble nucleotide-excising tRNase
MDSGAMFIVSTLVREMVEVCYNNVSYLDNQVQGDYIKQIFILTHNVYFHKEITHNQVHRYNCVSFFFVNKVNNNSEVRLCIQDNIKIPTEKENYNPIRNSYMALWHEYKDAETATSLLNVIRRILEYYFIQLCGYDGTNLRKRVLEDNKEKFVETPANGLPDYTKYHLASAMLSYISSNTIGVSDGLNYTDDCTDASLYKTVFMIIFKALQQDQHYDMMMNEIE